MPRRSCFERGTLFRGEEVALGAGDDDWCGEGGVPAREVGERGGVGFTGVDQVKDNVRIAQRLERHGPHGVLEGDGGIDESWCVDEDDLGVVEREDPRYAVPRRLGLGARYRELLADQPVEQGGFPHVRPSDDGYKSSASH
jgi:hypothetical protein